MVPETADGTVEVASKFGFSFAFGQGQFTGDALTGTFEAIPLDGDCITKVVTRAMLRIEVVLQTG